jgi:hypothetical protein
MTLNPNYGRKTLIVSIKLSPIYFVVLTEIPLPFEKGCRGQLELQKWALDGSMEMGGGSSFGKINGLARVVWLSNFENYIQ